MQIKIIIIDTIQNNENNRSLQSIFFRNLRIPHCVLPTANDIFPNNGYWLKIAETHPDCKFIGYQSYYHKKKYNDWFIRLPTVHIPHCVRTNLFKRQTPYNPSGKIIAGGRLIPKKRTR
jgi:hypothetical protein